jgi:hypothetical protein
LVELTLALLVARVFANDTQRVLPLNDAAALTEAFDGSSDFHFVVGLRGQKIAPENAGFSGAMEDVHYFCQRVNRPCDRP